MSRALGPLTLLCGATALVSGCNPPPDAADIDGTRGSRVDVYFNDPGGRVDTIWRADAVKVMIDLIDSANASIRLAVMGFTNDEVIDAFIRAYDRGVVVEMVGDAGHMYNDGYVRFDERHIPMSLGNLGHIMHDKFMVVDDRFVFASTANWSDTDLYHNSNNFVMVDSPAVAADFTAEHRQMMVDSRFGFNKVEIDNGRVYQLGDTTVEVWFSPNEDAMGRILELVDGAQDSVWFTIFAFTKDQLGSAFIRKQEELARQGRIVEGDISVGIAGVVDQSQLHSNGQYHESYRLLGAKIPMRLDGNDASKQPGDYQAGGGRLHSKTMVIDADGENPIVISGSFNWSAAATVSNDEYLMVYHGGRVAKAYQEYFRLLWDNARPFGEERVGEAGLEAGDVVIDEVHWYGAHERDIDGFDEFIELRNLTDRDLRLDMWQISGVDDFVVGIPPGAVIPANGRFSIVDHLVEVYVDGAPQDQNTAFLGGDLVVNAFNDDRQARLYLKDEALELFLLDPDANVVDSAGDGGPAFAGGPSTTPEGAAVVRSMQRAYLSEAGPAADGSQRDGWMPSPVAEGGANVNPDVIVPGRPETYKDTILATPGEAPPEGTDVVTPTGE
jgi:phosphatidylserine/phosphatidylglycerophosphate/cardiolipin synthase-like enzyme